ncbi:tyrosine-type recombinase/integrase [Neisseria lactamica]|uniref:tyrosine-type recombinase/integrase n=1 Tax=Neisseria lactamica TaxID=486 RepID=UPI0027E1A29B|nr:integrase arm-type DNA-binding domain-containing protein [Neisseria lactamica]
MPKIITPLTAAQVKNAKPKDRLYKLADGGGLALWVKPNGSKVWRFSFNGENGKPQTLTLGAYPLFSLVQAREWRDEQKRKLALGQNIKRVKVRTAYTLEKIACEWHEKWRKDMAEKYTVQVMRNFERYIFPVIGNRDIRQIKTIDVVECLRIMERRGIADSLRKTKNSLNLVFSYAVGSGLIEYNPVLQIGKQVFEKPKNRHMAALPPSELPLLIDFLEQRNGFANPTNRLKITPTTRLAIYWLLLTMTRVQETALARWDEIDEKSGQWIIPAERKKERREHIVPLSTAMKLILQQARELNVNGVYLFESYNYRSHINKEAPRMAMQRAGLKTTAHGLRSLARTYLREELNIDNDVAEKLLAHSLGTKTQTAYNRSELLKERGEALEKWGNVILTMMGNSQQA